MILDTVVVNGLWTKKQSVVTKLFVNNESSHISQSTQLLWKDITELMHLWPRPWHYVIVFPYLSILSNIQSIQFVLFDRRGYTFSFVSNDSRDSFCLTNKPWEPLAMWCFQTFSDLLVCLTFSLSHEVTSALVHPRLSVPYFLNIFTLLSETNAVFPFVEYQISAKTIAAY